MFLVYHKTQSEPPAVHIQWIATIQTISVYKDLFVSEAGIKYMEK